MNMLSTTFCYKSLFIYGELLNDARGDVKVLENYLCQVEAWENFSREQALEFVWNTRDSFKKMCDTCYGQKQLDTAKSL